MSLYHCGTRAVDEPDWKLILGQVASTLTVLPPSSEELQQVEGHAHVPGQQGLPLRLESGLEGGRQQQQQLGGEQEPRGAGEGRPLQLEQHPEAHCRPVEEGGLCDL
ncbi:hypothetical protein L3Q82_003202 [Scortum barcoo]|uniref:Uncharacterized protein n=1 Tax=Scortum barcoo TaxID=214431 RepID=A0ACB8VS01_9TELE|nr:hypothetical protein L3Q82_003202 [Scortum barcoo]